MKEDKVKKALKASLSKYKRLIRLYRKSKPKDQRGWFLKHLLSDTCPLCAMFFEDTDKDCPLFESQDIFGCRCCKEWQYANKASEAGKLTDWHLIAIYCRIERELEAA